MLAAKELMERISSQREHEGEELRKALNELEIEKARKTMLSDLKSGTYEEKAKDNKYIMSGLEDAEQNISKFECKVNEIREKIDALTYQLNYMISKGV